MPAQKLKEFLDKEHVKYVSCIHAPAFTAQEVAASAHVPGQELAKTVMLNVDGRMVMAVLPANRKIALSELREDLGAAKARFASEDEFKALFPDCEPGAMPPFGNLYGIEVYVAPELAEDDEIAFSAGTHTELIRMPYKDFARLVHPRMTSMAA